MLTPSAQRFLDRQTARHGRTASAAYSAPGVLVSYDAIRSVTCSYHGVPLDRVLSKTRRRVVVDPRQQAVFIAEYLTGMPALHLAAEFGMRDHGAVHYARKQVAGLYEMDREYRRRMVEMCAGLDMTEQDVDEMVADRAAMIAERKRGSQHHHGRRHGVARQSECKEVKTVRTNTHEHD